MPLEQKRRGSDIYTYKYMSPGNVSISPVDTRSAHSTSTVTWLSFIIL